MSERELYKQLLPQIIETIVLLSRLNEKDYIEWREAYLKEIRGRKGEAFGQKILTIIEVFLYYDKEPTGVEIIYEYFSKYLEDEPDTIYEVEKAERAYLEYVNRMDEKQQLDLYFLADKCMMAYRKQGFINGFRYAKRLLMTQE